MTSKLFERKEIEENEALARLESILIDGGGTKEMNREVQSAVQKGFDLNIPHFDLNEVENTDKHKERVDRVKPNVPIDGYYFSAADFFFKHTNDRLLKQKMIGAVWEEALVMNYTWAVK